MTMTTWNQRLCIVLYWFSIFFCFGNMTSFTFSLFIGWLGWRISDESIRHGLEHTHLLGRSQLLTSEEAKVLGLTGATILLDGGWLLFSFYCHGINWWLEFYFRKLGFIFYGKFSTNRVKFSKKIYTWNLDNFLFQNGHIVNISYGPVLLDSLCW